MKKDASTPTLGDLVMKTKKGTKKNPGSYYHNSLLGPRRRFSAVGNIGYKPYHIIHISVMHTGCNSPIAIPSVSFSRYVRLFHHSLLASFFLLGMHRYRLIGVDWGVLRFFLFRISTTGLSRRRSRTRPIIA